MNHSFCPVLAVFESGQSIHLWYKVSLLLLAEKFHLLFNLFSGAVSNFGGSDKENTNISENYATVIGSDSSGVKTSNTTRGPENMYCEVDGESGVGMFNQSAATNGSHVIGDEVVCPCLAFNGKTNDCTKAGQFSMLYGLAVFETLIVLSKSWFFVGFFCHILGPFWGFGTKIFAINLARKFKSLARSQRAFFPW